MFMLQKFTEYIYSSHFLDMKKKKRGKTTDKHNHLRKDVQSMDTLEV